MRTCGWIFSGLCLLTVSGAVAQTHDFQAAVVVPNGPVHVIAESDDLVYLGGDFTAMGRYTGSAHVYDATTGDLKTFYQRQTQVAQAAVSDGTGGWFVSGNGSNVSPGGRGITHYLGDGSTDPAWNPVIDDLVTSMVASGGILYFGGRFKNVDGQSRISVAAVDIATGELTPWNPQVYNLDERTQGRPLVSALAIDGTTIYVGGRFRAAGARLHNGMAALSTLSNTALSFTPQFDPTDSVRSIALTDTDLYVGGIFDSIGGVAANNVAKINRLGQHVTSWVASTEPGLTTLTVTDSSLYVGGVFQRFNGEDRQNLVEVDLATGALLAWDPGVNGLVTALDLDGDTLRVGGQFSTLGGQDRSWVGAVSRATGLATAWNPQIDHGVWEILREGNDIFLGGQFQLTDAVPRGHAAALNKRFNQVTNWNPEANGIVHAILPTDTTVYLGGEFTELGGEAHEHIGATTVATGAPAAGWSVTADDTVHALAFANSTVFAGGEFDMVDGVARNGLAAFDDATGVLMAWDPNLVDPSNSFDPGVINALVADGSTLYVGGLFDAIGGMDRSGIAAVDVNSGIATPFAAPSITGPVNSLSLVGSRIYAAGPFFHSGGGGGGSAPDPAGTVPSFGSPAAFDIATGNHIAWTPVPNLQVRAVAATSSAVFIGGWFSEVDDVEHRGIASLNPATAIAADWNPLALKTEALLLTGASLYAGGDFSSVRGIPHPYFARFNNVLPEITLPPLEDVTDFLLNLGNLTPEEEAAADANIDGKVDVADVVTVVNQDL